MPAGTFAPSKLHIDYGEWTKPAIGSTDTGKAWVWNNATAKYEPAAYTPVAPGGSTTQVQYNNAGAFAGDAGMTYDAAADRLTVAGGLITSSMRPASDSTTALQWQNAAGAAVVTIDTIGGYVESKKFVAKTDSTAIGLDIWAQSGGYAYQHLSSNAGAKKWLLGMNADESFFLRSMATTNMQLRISQATQSIAIGRVAAINTALGLAVSGNAAETSGSATDAVVGFSRATVSGAAWGQLFGIKLYRWEDTGTPLASRTAVILSAIHGATNSLDVDIMTLRSDGRVGIGVSAPTSLLDIAASTTARASLRIRSGTWATAPNDGDIANNGNAIAMMINGTNAVNTDGGLAIWMQSSMTARNVGRLLWQYTDKTDATRVTEGSLTAFYQSTEHKAMRWRGGSGGPMLCFGEVTTPIVIPVVATGSSSDDIITALQALGLVKQS